MGSIAELPIVFHLTAICRAARVDGWLMEILLQDCNKPVLYVIYYKVYLFYGKQREVGID